MGHVEKKRDTYESINAIFEGRKMVLNAFKSGVFSLPPTEGTGLKTHKKNSLKIANSTCTNKSR